MTRILRLAINTRRGLALVMAMFLALAAVPPLLTMPRAASSSGGIAVVVLACIAAASFVKAARRRAMGDSRFWHVLAAALLLGAAAAALLAAAGSHWVTKRAVELPLVLFAFAANALALVGLVLTPVPGSTSLERTRRIQDGSITAAAFFCILWALGVRPHNYFNLAGAISVVSISRPVVNAIMLTLVVQLLAEARSHRLPLLAFSSGLFLIIFANTGLAAATARDADLPNWLYPAWTVGLLWLVVGSTAADEQPLIRSGRNRLHLVLPYAVAVVGAWATYASLLVHGRLDPVLMTGALLMFLLVVIRQAVIARDNVQLVLEREGARIREAEEAARAEAIAVEVTATERFLATMTHEFRTPLNSILGFSQLALTLGLDLDPKTRKYFTNIEVAGRHLLALVNDVLDLSKAQAGKLELNFEAADAVEAACDCIAQLAPVAAERNVALRTPTGRYLVRADRRRLVQILLNLLSNAVKFTPGGGQVAVAVTSEGSYVEIAVSDTGLGIAIQDQERIFREYAQVSSPETENVGGTGLGLPLSQRFAHHMGGEITVRSSIGVGSTFTLKLPIAISELRPEAEAD